MHRVKRQRHCARHWQFKPDQPLQAFGPAAMGWRRHRRSGGYKRDIWIIWLHCGTFFVLAEA